MHVYSSTENICLLVYFKNTHGIVNFFYHKKQMPGLFFEAKARHPIVDQIYSFLGEVLKEPINHLTAEVHPTYSDKLNSLEEEQTQTLYLVGLKKDFSYANISYAPIPLLLKEIPGRRRLIYLRAWQVLLGGLEQETKVIESDDLTSLSGNL